MRLHWLERLFFQSTGLYAYAEGLVGKNHHVRG